MPPVTVSELHNVEPLREVPASQLQWLIDASRCRELADGDLLFKSGDPIKETHVLLSGRIKICLVQNNQSQQIAEVNTGNITGYLPFSRIKAAMGNGECVGSCRIMSTPLEVIRQAISLHYELTEALVHAMTSRVREFTQMQQQNEKMMALGKLSAGLAHELNNPAAAITRNAFTLKKQLLEGASLIKQLASIQITMPQSEVVISKLMACNVRKEGAALTLMERSEQEDEVADWLLDHHITSAGTADELVEAGITLNDLEDLGKDIPDQYLPPILNWLISHLLSGRLVNDIHESAKRISDLVNSVKRFTYMDRAPDKESINIHDGIRNTLTMLEYKLRKGNIKVVENFDPGLPKVSAMPGALNQVWTNLIDNAIDAMEANGSGKLEISTGVSQEQVQVLITDNGQGIPEDIRTRIFDPFFTTKEMGKGTGLGLDVVSQVINRHHGQIRVDSVPGRTEFKVCLPLVNN